MDAPVDFCLTSTSRLSVPLPIVSVWPLSVTAGAAQVAVNTLDASVPLPYAKMDPGLAVTVTPTLPLSA